MRTWAVLAGLYGIDIVLTQKAGYATEAGLLLVAAAMLLWEKPTQRSAGVVAAAAFVGLVGPASSTETAFVMWTSLALALFVGVELAQACRVLVTVVYTFAAANKLFPTFRSGEVLERYTDLPAVELLAWAAIASEAALAVLMWRRWRHLPVAVVAFHVPVALLVGFDLRHTLSLLVYGAMMWWVTSLGVDEHRDLAHAELAVVGLVDVSDHRPDLDVAGHRPGGPSDH